MTTVVSRFGFVVILAALAFLAVRGDLFSAGPVATAAQLVALVLAVWARWTFRRGQFRVAASPGAGALMTDGPYRFVRHPMYAAMLLLIWSGIVGHWSLLNGAVGAVVLGVLAVRIGAEERLLRERYPEYEAYARRTRRIIPFVL